MEGSHDSLDSEIFHSCHGLGKKKVQSDGSEIYVKDALCTGVKPQQ